VSNDKALDEAVKQLIPKNLDDIIRLRRDEFTLRLSSAQEIAELPPMVSIIDNQMQVSATINEWRIICLDLHAAGKKYILTGYNQSTKTTWGTSEVASADINRGLILTKNSIYRLGTKGEGEPTSDLLLHICALFHQWGSVQSLVYLKYFTKFYGIQLRMNFLVTNMST
jgi:hypothetical protein